LVADHYTEAADALIHSEIGDRITVVLTGSQRETLRAASARRFDLALVNLGVSDAAGGNLIPLLQDVLAETPIIAIDDVGDPESERFAFALGATWYLAKPLDQSHLLRVVKSTLRRPARAGRETAA
jgi:DNA-binding response OmpR family regulator